MKFHIGILIGVITMNSTVYSATQNTPEPAATLSQAAYSRTTTTSSSTQTDTPAAQARNPHRHGHHTLATGIELTLGEAPNYSVIRNASAGAGSCQYCRLARTMNANLEYLLESAKEEIQQLQQRLSKRSIDARTQTTIGILLGATLATAWFKRDAIIKWYQQAKEKIASYAKTNSATHGVTNQAS